MKTPILTLSRPLSSVLAAAVLCAAASTQNVLSYQPAGAASLLFEECIPGAACGSAGVPSSRTFAGPLRPTPPGVLDGAIAVDDRHALILATNGHTTIKRSRYPTLGCGSSGGALPDLSVPAAIGTVTGMAVDPGTNHLFLTNGTMLFRVDPSAGMTILCSWSASPLNILSGLEFDPAIPGELLAVSTAGEVARYSICGGLLSVSSPTYAWPGSPAVGVALDRTDAAGGQTYVLRANGDIYFHPAGPLLRNLAAGRVGLSFLPSALRLPGAVACAGASATPRISTLAFSGSTGFGLELCGIPAGTPFAVALLGLPSVPVPIAALPAGLLWVNAPIALGVPVAAGASSVGIPLSLAGITAPLDFDVQWGLPCSTSAVGHVLTDALQIEVGR